MQPKALFTLFVDPLGGRYPTKESLMQFFTSIEREMSRTPQRSKHRVGEHPAARRVDVRRHLFEVVGDPPLEENRRPTTDYQIVSPAYFSTLDLPVVEGRAFTDADTADGTLVCIVNEAFVRRHLLGHR